MITWLFDRKNQWGVIPNLISRTDIVPNSKEWWDLCVQPPYSYEFRFLKYCSFDKVEYRLSLVSDIWQAPAYYPVNLNFWDSTLDYFSYMSPDSLAKLQRGDFKILFYYSEGDDVNIEIKDHINRLASLHNIDNNNIIVVSANWLSSDERNFFYFPDDELYYRYINLMKKDSDWVKEINFSPRHYKSTCLIRADKIWRKIFASYFVRLGLNNHSQFSYNNYNYETPFIEEDDIKYWSRLDDELLQVISSFELHLPYKCDDLLDSDHNNHKLINRRFFNESYWNIVVETHFNQKTVFLTEKTFKPILNLQPFIILGPPDTLKLLKHLGYQTFDQVLDEKYDNITDDIDRMHAVIEASYSLDQRNDQEHINLQHLMAKALMHNQQHFLRPKVSRIKNLLAQLEY